MLIIRRGTSRGVRVARTSLLILIAGTLSSPPKPAQAASPPGYTLAWSDEFNGPVGSLPNLQNWAPAIGNNFGWGNGDLENYGFDTTHCSIISDSNATDGKALQITATHDDSTYNVGDFTSVRLQSIGKFNFGYGYLEFRAKAPVGGNGIWPALWTLGSDFNIVNWPNCGEQDIMEIFGKDMTTNNQSWHFAGNSWTTADQLPGAASFSAGYHTFGLLWTQQGVFSSVDGTIIASHQDSDSPGYVFDHPNFLLMNLAIGGPNNPALSVVGTPDATTPFPQNFDIDYVRYYAPPASQIQSPGYGTVTDTCDNFSVAYTTSGGDLAIDNSNPQLFNGDGGRISRTFDDTAWVEYKYQNISAATVTVGTNTGDNTPISLWYSMDGGTTYTQAQATVGGITPVQSGWGYYTVSVAGLPSGVTDLKVQMAPTVIPWDHQLMSVTITSGSPAAAPPAPTEITATGINNGAVVTWQAASNATSYDIYRSTSPYDEISAPPINAQPVITGVAGTSFTDTGLVNGTTYNYMVAAVDAAGLSWQTPQASATAGSGSCTVSPSAPTGLAASGTTSSQTTLTWNAAASGCTVSNYTVYQNGVAIASAPGTSWIAEGLSPGSTYQFTVSATDGNGISPQSAPISVTTSGTGGSCTAAPSAPTGLAASGTTASGTTLTWNAQSPPTNCSITSFAVFENGTSIGTASGNSFSVTGLSASTSYTFAVAAIDSFGMSPQSSAISVTTGSAGGSCTASPSVPTGLAASGITSSGATLTWNSVSPPANCTITSYTVSKNGTSIGTSAGNSFTVSGLAASTTYTFTVAATDSSGTSAQSASTSVTTSAATCAASPTAPTGLAASNTTASGTTLAWTAVSPPANCSVSGYTVFQNGTSIGTATTNSFTVSGLSASTTYTFTVAATDSVGTGSQSASVSVTTGAGQSGPLQIDCGGGASGSWAAEDEFFSGGTPVSVTNQIDLSGAPYPAPTQSVMQTERDGNVTYTITGLVPNSSHTACLFFSENNFNASGQRQFNVAINGNTVLSNFDVYANTGAEFKAIEQSFSTTASSSGQIVITLTTVKYNAEINGIAIL